METETIQTGNQEQEISAALSSLSSNVEKNIDSPGEGSQNIHNYTVNLSEMIAEFEKPDNGGKRDVEDYLTSDNTATNISHNMSGVSILYIYCI